MTNPRPLAAITGASSGLGAAFARHCAASGHDLMLVARRVDRLAELARELTDRHGIHAEVVPADLTRDDDVTRVAERLASSEALTLLVNNAGFGTRGYFFEADAARQDAMHRLHVIAPERLIRAALPGMVRRARGAIINVASIGAFVPDATNISYCATKAWVKAFTEGLWLELQILRSPVKVQALCPGFTYTELQDVMGIDRGTVPKRWWMEADDVVAASLQALQAGRLIVVPGWRNRWLVRVVPLIPRTLLLRIARGVRKPPSSGAVNPTAGHD